MALLEVENLQVNFRTHSSLVQAVNGISFSIEEGETLGLVGETGAGKTTTAMSILRLLSERTAEYADGKITFEGEELLQADEKELQKVRGRKISMIFQDPMTALNPTMPVLDQIMECVEIHDHVSKQEAKEKAEEILETVGIPAARGKEFPHQFSGGMKQRVVIAMALVCSPKLLLADEPTTALDVTIQAQILEMIQELKKKNNTAMLLITHDLGVVAENCDRVAVIYAGEIVEYGNLEQIFEKTAHPYTEGLFDSLPSLDKMVDRLKPIPGMMPDPANLPEGCKFHSRCKYATDVCKSIHPDMKDLGEGHQVRCHNYQERKEEV
jgi:peptide/nickel transport system ATP-binding protein